MCFLSSKESEKNERQNEYSQEIKLRFENVFKKNHQKYTNNLLTLLPLQLNSEHTIVVLMVERHAPLAILAVRLVVWIVDQLPEVYRVQRIRVQPRARDIAHGKENAAPVERV